MQKMQALCAHTEASSDGFRIAQQPAANAGATFHAAINMG